MMWKKYVCMLCLSVMTISLVACGSRLDNPGVDSNKQLDELTTGDQEKLSEALAEEVYTKENIDLSCKLAAYVQAGSGGKAKCESFLKICEVAATTGAQSYSQSVMQQFSKCKDVTVKQWATCMKVMNRYLQQLRPAIAGYSCDNPPNLITLLASVDAETIKDYQLHCQTVLSKCNGAGGIGTPSSPDVSPPPQP